MIAASISIVTVANLYFYFLYPQITRYFFVVVSFIIDLFRILFRQYSPMHYGSTQYIAVPCTVKSTPVSQVIVRGVLCFCTMYVHYFLSSTHIIQYTVFCLNVKVELF